MSQHRLILTELPCKDLIESIEKLDTKGWIAQTEHYCYLKIDDRFVHHAYPFLHLFGPFIEKPDYFDNQNAIGAHISAIYPEEHAQLMTENVGQIHHFQIGKLLKITFETANYYVLTITSTSLERLRQMHHLAIHPTFKGHKIMFHVTLGVQYDNIVPK